MNNNLIGLIMVYDSPEIKAAFINIQKLLLENNFESICFDSLAEFRENTIQLRCAVVVGGDGSILAVADIAAKHKIPLIGVNRGKLGFLSDINPDNCQQLLEMLAGKFMHEQRSMLEVSVNGFNDKFLALNEVAINRKDDTHLLNYDILVDDYLMCTQRSDGVLLHTPTGSTAYALSAGGPIIQPLVNAFGIVPLNPHRLNTRPIVIKNSQTITILLSEHNIILSCDGRKINISKINKITVKKSKHDLILMHPQDYDYFKVLRTKLHWEY